MPKGNEDTKKKIELEKAKWELAKYKFDAMVAIARDIVLILAILGGSTFNFMSGNLSKASTAPSEVYMESAGLGLSGTGGGGGGSTVSSAAPARFKSYRTRKILNVNTGLWVVVGLAVVFLILPRLKRKTKKEE